MTAPTPAAFAGPVDVLALAVLAAATLLLALVALRMQRRLRSQSDSLEALQRELALWRDASISMGRQLAERPEAAAPLRPAPPRDAPSREGDRATAVAPETAAPGRAAVGDGNKPRSRRPAQVINLPAWLPDNASDEDLAMAAGLTRSEAHLANRLRNRRPA